jgi:hypothetical protein
MYAKYAGISQSRTFYSRRASLLLHHPIFLYTFAVYNATSRMTAVNTALEKQSCTHAATWCQTASAALLCDISSYRLQAAILALLVDFPCVERRVTGCLLRIGLRKFDFFSSSFSRAIA